MLSAQAKGATMRAQGTSGLFISLIRTLLTKAGESRRVEAEAEADTVPVVNSDIVPIYPRVDVMAHLLVLRVLSRKVQERLAETDRLGDRVFRYSSSGTCTSSL